MVRLVLAIRRLVGPKLGRNGGVLDISQMEELEQAAGYGSCVSKPEETEEAEHVAAGDGIF